MYIVKRLEIVRECGQFVERASIVARTDNRRQAEKWAARTEPFARFIVELAA